VIPDDGALLPITIGNAKNLAVIALMMNVFISVFITREMLLAPN